MEIFCVKVPGTKPLITLEDLQKPGSRYFVDFGNASVAFYVDNGRVAVSVSADTIQLLDYDEEVVL